MIVRGIDGIGDWLFGKGKNDFKRDQSAIAQNIRTRLQSFVGDCFFAIDDGVDWFNLLGTKNVLEMRLGISAVILNTEGVTGIVELELNLSDTRRITLQYSADTIFGRVSGTIDQGV